MAQEQQSLLGAIEFGIGAHTQDGQYVQGSLVGHYVEQIEGFDELLQGARPDPANEFAWNPDTNTTYEIYHLPDDRQLSLVHRRLDNGLIYQEGAIGGAAVRRVVPIEWKAAELASQSEPRQLSLPL